MLDGEIHDGISVNVIIMDFVDGPSVEAFLDKLTNPRMRIRSKGGFNRIRPGELLSESDEDVMAIKVFVGGANVTGPQNYS